MKVSANNQRALRLLLTIVIICGVALTYWLLNAEEDLPILAQGDSFTLEAHDRTEYNSDNGKVKLLAFFYTNCPDICPLTMLDFKELQARLQEEDLFGEKVELLAITLDPEHDTVDLIDDYANRFNANANGWKFLRATPARTKEIAESYHMKYQKLEGDFIAHNTTMFLIDQDHNIRSLYDMANQKKVVEKEEILDSIHILIDEASETNK